MAYKIKLSESIGLQLKEFRTQYQIRSKDIAELIGKSPAYISKLEKGQIQQIEKKDLMRITNFIVNSDEGYNIFCEKIAARADLNDLEHDILLLNFDLMERKIPLYDGVINIIKDKMELLCISDEELSTYINKNEDLGTEFFVEHNIESDSIEKNLWLLYQEVDGTERLRSFIVLEYLPNRIEKFISGKIHKCEYMFPYAMLYHLLKWEYKKNGEKYDDILIDKCKVEAEEILLQNKFYSLSIKARFSTQSETEEEYQKLLSKFDIDNMAYISDLLGGIQFLSKYDIEYTNEKLERIVRNFKECDPSFSLAFMSTPLIGIKELQTSLKKEFLNEISEVVKKYSDMVLANGNIEKY